MLPVFTLFLFLISLLINNCRSTPLIPPPLFPSSGPPLILSTLPTTPLVPSLNPKNNASLVPKLPTIIPLLGLNPYRQSVEEILSKYAQESEIAGIRRLPSKVKPFWDMLASIPKNVSIDKDADGNFHRIRFNNDSKVSFDLPPRITLWVRMISIGLVVKGNRKLNGESLG